MIRDGGGDDSSSEALPVDELTGQCSVKIFNSKTVKLYSLFTLLNLHHSISLGLSFLIYMNKTSLNLLYLVCQIL